MEKKITNPSGQSAGASGGSPLRGLRALADALRHEDFPMEKRDIDYSVGDIEVEDGKGGFVPVRDLTGRLQRETFDTAESVVRALQGVLQHRRAA